MAPLPRPPQPIRATLISSLPAAYAEREMFKLPAKAAPATAAVVPLRKSRREGVFFALMESSFNRGGNYKVGREM
jgi:glycyl-tRNA synthetase (class II)